MDLKIILSAVVAVATCLMNMGINAGEIYHNPRHQCIPPLVRLWQPTTYTVQGVIICTTICYHTSCLFFEFSETDGSCNIYGMGMEPGNAYVKTEAAAPPPGGPLEEKARNKTTYPVSSLEPSYKAVDNNLVSFWEYAWLKPWWMVDLGAFYFIHQVSTLSRPEPLQYRYEQVEVRAGPELRTDGILSQWELVGYYPSSLSGKPALVFFNNTQGVCGRFVSVQRVSAMNDAFALANVEVYVRKNV
ncbi:uncharacterized protein LOC135214623 [Macrobrachium nipponense]|uniref:uncharacterized protein LOC135214623 n=1 Tax=Macrobrachium nipponense TaxID=159736 RepID=UPI0030C8CF85